VRRHPWYTQTAYATDPERIDMASMIVPTSSIDLDPLVMKVLHPINIASHVSVTPRLGHSLQPRSILGVL
jgi:hypothetical protein